MGSPGDLAQHQGGRRILAWAVMDSDLVVGLSSCAIGSETTCERKVVNDLESADSVKKVARPGPDAWKQYNKNYGGVDVGDSKKAAYTLHLKIPHRWPTSLFLKFLFETTIVNACITWADTGKGRYPSSHANRNFRMKVIEWMTGRAHFPTVNEAMTVQADPHWPARRYNEQGKPVARQCAVCHVGESKAAIARAKAMNESLGAKPSTFCARCDVHLCIGEPGEDSCYVRFHRDDKYSHLRK